MKKLVQRLHDRREGEAQETRNRKDILDEKLAEVEKGIRNITDAIAAGLLSEALVQRLSLLEQEKRDLEWQMCYEGYPHRVC